MNTKEIPFGYVKDSKIYLNAWGGHPEREIGQVRENDVEASIQYFVNKFNELSEKVAQLEKVIESAENKGSFLMKLLHLKDSLPQHDGLGDYQALLEALQRTEGLLNELIQANRVKNTEIKKELVEEMKVATEAVNWREATETIHDIKTRWIKTGNASPECQEELEQEFWGMVTAFFERKKAFYEDMLRLTEKRKADYEALILEARQVDQLHGKERFELIKSLKGRWAEVGKIPRTDYLDLTRRFQGILKKPARNSSFHVDPNTVLSELKTYLTSQRSPGIRDLENIKKQFAKYRPQDPDERHTRREILQTVQLLTERDFLDKLAIKRFPDFKELETEKKKTIRLGILSELIQRDQSELAKFQENSANFSSRSGEMNELLEKKLGYQKSKIIIKEKLYELIKNS